MPQSQLLRCTVEEDDGRAVVVVDGELDISTVGDFRGCTEPLVARGLVSLVLDLSGTEFLDSTGLSAMLDLQRSAQAAGGGVALQRPSAFVERVLEISGTRRLFGAGGEGPTP